jgi:predicted PurR-regulated permease PerM
MADVRRKSLGRPVLYALIFAGLYLGYRILGPFLVALTWAAIFASLFHRTQVWLVGKMTPNHAAVVTTLVVAALIVAPAGLLITTVAREVPQVTDHMKQASQGTPQRVQRIWDAVRAHSPVALPEDPMQLMTTGAQRAAKFLAPHAGAILGDFFATLGHLVAMLFALFFMLRDGDWITGQVRDRLPFSAQESESLLRETRDLVVASVGAGLAVAIAQGILGGLAFWIVGISAPAFWGVVMGLSSVLPIGATLVWVPTSFGLLLSGEIGRGVGLLLMGTFGISMVANVLRPLLLSGKASISGFIIFFGLLGGAAAFGFVGLVIGPIILVITGRLLETLHRPDLLDETASARDVIVPAKAS